MCIETRTWAEIRNRCHHAPELRSDVQIVILGLEKMSVVRKSSFTFRHLAQRDLFICLGTSVSAQGWELGAFIRHIPISSKITDNVRANRAACRMLCI